MERFDGAVIKEQGVTFAVAVVRRSVIANGTEADQAIAAFSQVFEGLPVVLMAQDNHGTPEYYGRPDLSEFMASVPLETVPWSTYGVSD